MGADAGVLRVVAIDPSALLAARVDPYSLHRIDQMLIRNEPDVRPRVGRARQ
jgi:hypothetical protein